MMKKTIALLIALTMLAALLPTVGFGAGTPYSTLFSWNFTTGKHYSTTKVSGTSATAVSWGDYRAAFMVFPMPQLPVVSEDEVVRLAITDSAMVWDNGRSSGQAPIVSVFCGDGAELMTLFASNQSGAMSDADATAALKAWKERADYAGDFATLSSDSSSALDISTLDPSIQYVGFYLTCRSEDGAGSAGIVNFVQPQLSVTVEAKPEDALRIEAIESVGLKVGASTNLTVEIAPSAAAITSVVSSNPTVAAVAATERTVTLEGIAAGFAEISVTAQRRNEEVTATFHVLVSNQFEEKEPKEMNLIQDGKPVAIVTDPTYENNAHGYGQLMRAVGDLRQDFALVAGSMSVNDLPMDDTPKKQQARLAAAAGGAPALLTDPRGAGSAIIIGSIDDSAIIRDLMVQGRLDEAATITGSWEGYVIKTIENPVEGLDRALVIAGSDIRGTIYGLYALSEYMGVSPWYWWSDVPIKTQSSLTYPAQTIVNKGPDVKYRGIFLNDEERLVDWSEVHFPDDYDQDGNEINGPNEFIYRRFFEVLLRLGANTLWPAMHEYTTAFNQATDENGIPINAKAADEYGIVMSSSHCEILLRNNVGEWDSWYRANKEKYNLQGSNSSNAYDYTLNKDAILAYWRERVESNKDFESIYVLGIRGVHDGAPKYANLAGAGYGSGTAGIVKLQKDVIEQQRNILADVFGSADAVAQVFIPYKEMNTYYNYNNGELAAWLPDDIMIMYAEDNQGYLRQTTTAAERNRSGGAGVYYHNSYWGVPKSYLWLNSMPVYLMYEEMKKAYDTGSRKYWILNVGDLKPGELSAEVFLRMAWDTDCYTPDTLAQEFYEKQAIRDYALSEADAALYADEMVKFSRYIQAKRPEFFGYGATGSATVTPFSASRVFPFSVNQHGDEGQRRVNDWNNMVEVLGGIMNRMDAQYQDAFYEQMYHTVLSNRNRTEEYVYYWKNKQAAEQGRYGSSKVYAKLSADAIGRLHSDQDYFDTLHGGKWNKMLNMDHIIYYQSNQGILMVRPDMYDILDKPSVGVGAVCEPCGAVDTVLTFDSLANNTRYIDIFGKNAGFEEYRIATDCDWLAVSKTEGSVYTEERITVSVDWDQLPIGESSAAITVYNVSESGETESTAATFTAKAVKKASLEANSYGEANGFVTVEAEHFTEMIPGSDQSRWEVVKHLGLSGDSMKGYPDLAEKATSALRDRAAKLVYRIRFDAAGTFSGQLHRIPTLNEGRENGMERSCQIGIGLDSAAPTILRGNRDTNGTWGDNVMRGYEPLEFTITVDSAGYHDLVVYKVDASTVFDRIVISTGAADASLIGPPESPNTIAGDRQAVAAPLAPSVSEYRPDADAVFENMLAAPGTVSKVAVVASPGAEIALESQNPDIAIADYENGILTVYALAEGTATFTAHITASGYGDGTRSFQVTVGSIPPSGGAYEAVDGRVVINASDALKNTPCAYITVPNQSAHTWQASANGEGIVVSPNSGTNWLNAASLSAAPAASYVMRLDAGTYYIAGNFSNPDDASDSFHCSVDGALLFSSNAKNNRAVTKKREWFTHSSWTLNVTESGEYTVTIQPREDGLTLNQLCISTTPLTDGESGTLLPCDDGLTLTPETLSAEERAALDARFTTLPQTVDRDLSLRATGVFGSDINWVSSNAAVVSDDGQVAIPQKGEAIRIATLTATFTCEDANVSRDYCLNVVAPTEMVLSTGDFTFLEFSQVQGRSYLSFDITPYANTDGFVGLTSGSKTPSAYADYAVCFRLRPDGTFDACNGSTYRAEDAAAYQVGATYHVDMVLDTPSQTYHAYVTDQDGQRYTVAENYAFRTQTDSFGRITARGGSGVAAGTFALKNPEVSPYRARILDAAAGLDELHATALVRDGDQPATAYIAFYDAFGQLLNAQQTPLPQGTGAKRLTAQAPPAFQTAKFLILSETLEPMAGPVVFSK